MGTLWELWTEISQDSDSLADPVLLECLQAGGTHRIFDDITDDNLKTILSMINSLLNDPKSREKGATVFNEMILNVKISRLISFQDTLISSLHLICKNIGSHLAQTALANFLPKCKDLPDVNQIVISSIISKAMSHCVEEFQEGAEEGRQPGAEVIKLLKICLLKYRGPSGNYRDRLEKAFVPLLDHENGDLVYLICEILPLLSSTGGGGSQGDKHSKDWNLMVTKLMKSIYDCLYQLYSDFSLTLEEENPFERETSGLSLPSILQPKVFLRISLLKRRLINLLSALSSYLSNTFPAQKPVPSKSILKIISHLISLSPVDLLNSAGRSHVKEGIFLAALLPSIHSSVFKVLDNLVLSVGSNLLPDSTLVEQLFSQEWKWIDKKKKSYEILKLEMYSSLKRWLTMTHGHVTEMKTLKMWIKFLIEDVQLEKETVELKLLPKSKKEKKQLKVQALTALSNSNAVNTYIPKSSKICESALEIFMLLIPSLDSSLHKAAYQLLGITQLHLYQIGSFASPYDDSNCREKLHSCLLELVINPNPLSVVSVGLIINLLKKGSQDPVVAVSNLCQKSISILERVVHPICPSFDFPSLNNEIRESHGSEEERKNTPLDSQFGDEVDEEEENYVETIDTGCQTDVESITINSDSEDDDVLDQTETMKLEPSDIKQIMADLKALRESVTDLKKASINASPQSSKTSNLSNTINSSTSALLLPPPPIFSVPRIDELELLNGHHSNKGRVRSTTGGNKRQLEGQDDDVVLVSDEDEEYNQNGNIEIGVDALQSNNFTKKVRLTLAEDGEEVEGGGDLGNLVINEIPAIEGVSEDLVEMFNDFVDEGATTRQLTYSL